MFMVRLKVLLLNRTKVTDIGVIPGMVGKGAFYPETRENENRIEMMKVPVSFAPGTKARAILDDLYAKHVFIWTEQVEY